MNTAAKMPTLVTDKFVEIYDFVSKESVKDNIWLMLNNKEPVAMAYHIELKSGRFEPCSTFYPGIRPIPAELPCQVWASRMMDSIKGDDPTYVMPFKAYEEAENMANKFNEVL